MADYWPKRPGADLWCSVDTVAQDTGLSRATVYRCMRQLQDRGWLVQTLPARQHWSPRYRPFVGEPMNATEDSESASAQAQGSHDATAGVASCDSEVASCDPNPLDSSEDTTTEGRTSSDTGSRTPERGRRPRVPRPLRDDEIREEWELLQQLVDEEGTGDDPWDVWHTLVREHNAHRPGSFMRARVEAGDWDGFVGSHGIGDYSDLRPA
jgi:hypothetical protein